jgi:CRP/FNR family transcriptional regulator, cyclic AMP receptor protein
MSAMSGETREGIGTALIGDALADPNGGARRIEHPEGAAVYEPGAVAEFLYYIHAGQVRTYLVRRRQSARLMEILGPGDWFGAEALIDGGVTSSRAVAVSPTIVSAVPVERIKDLLRRQPLIAMELIRQLATKLKNAREDAGRLVFDDCSARLLNTLLQFSASAAATPQADGQVMLHITHRQLAQAVGAARETVSLALTQLRQQSLLRTGRNRLTFNPQALREFARRKSAAGPA